MAISADTLAALAPNQLPDPIGIWPIAPGWWLLGLGLPLLLLIAGLIGYRWRQRAYRRHAERKLQALARAATHPQGFSRNCSALLKGICLGPLQRRECAPLSGERWERFLQQCCPAPLDQRHLTALCHYANPELYAGLSAPERQRLQAGITALCSTWIEKHHV